MNLHTLPMMASCSLILCASACASSSQNSAVTNLEKPAKSLSESLVQRMGQVHKVMRIAVLPFTDASGKTLDLGQYMADKVVAALGNDKRIELIERNRLDQVVKELKLSSVGLVSDDSVKSLGNMLGADAIVMGTFTDLGESVDLNCRIIEPESGRILGTANVTIAQDKVVKRLWRRSDGTASGSNLVVTRSPKDSNTNNGWLWATGTVAVASTLFGTGLGISAFNDSKWPPTDPDYQRRVEGAAGRATLASISFGVAGLSAGSALLLLMFGGESDSDTPQVTIMPTTTTGGIGFSLGGTIDW